MRKCSGNNFDEWGFDSIFEIECPHCGKSIELFKDEITRTCQDCKRIIKNNRGDYGCGQWCSSFSDHQGDLRLKFRKSKDRFIGSITF